MAKVLMTWEFGSGLGHVGPLRAIGRELVRRGHAVTLATPAANLPLCRQALAGTGMAILPAPTLPPSPMLLKYPCTYADTLHDGGYSSAEKVTTAVAAWLKLLDETQPDLLLAEFAPTPLLASRLRSFATASLGTGFVFHPHSGPGLSCMAIGGSRGALLAGLGQVTMRGSK